MGGELLPSGPGRFTSKKKTPSYPLKKKLKGPQSWLVWWEDRTLMSLPESFICPDRIFVVLSMDTVRKIEKLHHHYHISFMELGRLLNLSGLTYPEVSSNVYHDSFCQLGSSISLPWVIYFETFYLHVVRNFKEVVCSHNRPYCFWGSVAYPGIWFGGGFNKFSWGQRTERTGIWGR